ncbi:MAG TPA: hypothetical protein PLX06_05840, partial [Fimbriimonadaceae bacterium]|nr:hypothetical protein [Fimbriimonadaceae bacterium]
AEAATAAASADGDAWYLRALVAGAPDERLRYLDLAARKSPSTRNLRALARAQDEAGKPDDAATTFREALTRDPNNLYSLKALFDLFLRQEAHPDAEATARRMIEVEKSPYFTIRALPELVPAETTFARRYLASRTQDPKSRIDLLEPAIALLSDYAARTVPNVIRSVEAKMTQGYAGETLDDAIEKMELGKLLSAACAQAYEKLADPGRAQETAAKAKTFEEALSKLRGVDAR